MDIVVDLIVLAVELIWAVLKFLQTLCRVYLPAAFYLTSVMLLPWLTSGKVAVEHPRGAMNIAWGWRKWIDRSPEGKTILSPGLGELAGLVFWMAVAVFALLLRGLLFRLMH